MSRTRTSSVGTGALAILGVSSLLLAACGSATDATADVETLEVVDHYTDDPQRGFYSGLLQECADPLGLTIEHTPIPASEVPQSVLQRASSGTLPDILALDTPIVIPMADAGALSPLGQYNIEVTVAQNIQEASTYEGELYGLQPDVNTLGLFYHPGMLEEAGVEPPETWDELVEVAEALSGDGRYGIAFSANATHEGAWQLLPFLWTNGADETDLDTPETAEAIGLWTELVEVGAASEGVLNWGQRDVFEQFMDGNAAMMINGPWYFPLMDEENIEVGTVGIPVKDPSQEPVAPQGGTVWTVPETGDETRQQLAAQVVECMGSDEMMLRVATGRDTVPTNPSLIEEFIADRPDMETFAELAMNSRSRTAQLGPDWPEAERIIYTALQLALTGQANPEDAVARAMQE